MAEEKEGALFNLPKAKNLATIAIVVVVILILRSKVPTLKEWTT